MQPPYILTPKVLTLIAEISRFLGRYEGLRAPTPQPELRRQNRIRTIQGSLAIEGNTLDFEQVTAILDNRRVVGPVKDVLEVQNAVRLYQSLHTFEPTVVKDLLRAHAVLMKGLATDAGKFRSGAVGILKGSKVSHVAPPAKRVPDLVDDLFNFLKKDKNPSSLIQSCVIHYEIEFIHPFSDGNGRIGRFWQHLILAKFHPIFEHIPFESLVKKRQSEYYGALEQSDRKGDSTLFIEFSLEALRDSLEEFMKELKPSSETPDSRLQVAKHQFGQQQFSRKDYLQLFKSLSTSTASRDLVWGVTHQVLEKTGAKALTRYCFVGKTKG